MSITLIVVLALLYSVIIVSFCFSSRVRSLSQKLNPLLNLLNILVVLSVFVQLYITIDLFNKTTTIEYESKIKEFDARIDTLTTELEGNQNVCDFILKNEVSIKNGSHVPMNYFYFPMLESSLRSGELINKELRVIIYDAYHEMMLAQNIIDNTTTLEHFKVLVNPDNAILKRSSNLNEEQMGFLLNHTKLAKGYISLSLDKLPDFRKEYKARLAEDK